VFHGCFLASGFDNQKCAPLSRPEEAATNYTMTSIVLFVTPVLAAVAAPLYFLVLLIFRRWNISVDAIQRIDR
jgi:hypothetical protein